ncbi:MAG TPA: hypothetical protein VH560_02885 [Polyangia bacterium]|nr:hypothetical protein [Polyangia bacterium]
MSALHRLSADEWSWIAIGGLALAAAALVGLAWQLRRVPLRTVAFVGAIVAATAAVGAIEVAPQPGAAVVVGSDVVARVAPFAQADPVFVAAEGSRVVVERTRGQYAWVHGALGDGWVPADQIETIVPGVPGARPGA